MPTKKPTILAFLIPLEAFSRRDWSRGPAWPSRRPSSLNRPHVGQPLNPERELRAAEPVLFVNSQRPAACAFVPAETPQAAIWKGLTPDLRQPHPPLAAHVIRPALAGGLMLAEVMAALGHASLPTTSVYLHVLVDEAEQVGNLFAARPS
jgi:hypothetical protein